MNEEDSKKYAESENDNEVFQLDESSIVASVDDSPVPSISELDDDHGDDLFSLEAIDLTALKLESIELKLDNLHKEFQSKLKYDAHKEKNIDDLHGELREYKDGLVKKQVVGIMKDIIIIIDSIRKTINYGNTFDPLSCESEKFFKFAKGIIVDLEDLLISNDVEPFMSDDSFFDPARQRVILKVDTLDKSKDKTIVRRLCPGYSSDGKIIRPEKVAVNIFKEDAGSPGESLIK